MKQLTGKPSHNGYHPKTNGYHPEKKEQPASEKWYAPEVTNTGWDKDMDAGQRRMLMLKAHGGNNLASARAMQSLANVTKDRKTKAEAERDAKYFRRAHQQGVMHYPISRKTPRISRPMPRISPRSPRISRPMPKLR